MPSWEGKSRGTKLGYRIFVAVLRNFGVFPAYALLRFVALYYFLFARSSSKNTYRFFHEKLGFPVMKSVFNVYRNYVLFGQSLIDKIVLLAGLPNKFTFDFDGEHHLREMTAGKRGGMLISAHIGNWEIAGFLLKRLDTRINIVMYDGEHRQIKDYLEKVAGNRLVNIIVIRDDISHIYEISDALARNELVCMHADRFVEGSRTVNAPFLGEEARFPMGPFLLAARLKVPVSFVFAMKEKATHYHFFATALREYKGEVRDEVIRAMLGDFVNSLETKVREYPGQWYNYYNFWAA